MLEIQEEKMRFWILLLLLMGSPACSSWVVEDAFDGEFDSNQNNKIINEYCQSCHIHKDFDSGPHVDAMALKYNRKVFRYATECRTCHLIKRNFLTNSVLRETRLPNEANQGEFRDFEIDTLDDQKERLQEEAEQAESEEEKKAEKPKRKNKKERKKFLGIF